MTSFLQVKSRCHEFFSSPKTVPIFAFYREEPSLQAVNDDGDVDGDDDGDDAAPVVKQELTVEPDADDPAPIM